jgi:hypothetical protein
MSLNDAKMMFLLISKLKAKETTNIGYLKSKLDLYFMHMQLIIKFQANQISRSGDVWKPKAGTAFLYAHPFKPS